MWTDKEEQPPTLTTYEKGIALAKAGGLHLVGYCPVFVADGNLDQYHVILGEDGEYFCTCPATKLCNHVIGAREELKRIQGD